MTIVRGRVEELGVAVADDNTGFAHLLAERFEDLLHIIFNDGLHVLRDFGGNRVAGTHLEVRRHDAVLDDLG